MALGGGAARGWAHIGVVRALRDAGIEPDIWAGTSMGALVAGCDLGGKLDQLEAFALSLTTRRIFALLDLHIGGSGLIHGAKLATMLHTHLGETRIEELARPFVCVATELSTGHEIWLSTGRVVDALRASYALPGIFEPIRIGRRWLVDGALVNPVPVSVCRALGADLVIAVNFSIDMTGHGTVIHATAPEPDEQPPEKASSRLVNGVKRLMTRQLVGDGEGRPGMTGVMIESFNIIQDRITRSRLAGDPPDVMIAPKLGKIGLFDFHKAAEAISIGYEATRRAVADIRDHVDRLER